MAYYFVRMLSWLVCLLPRFVRVLLGDCLGELVWLIVPAKRKEMAINNIIRSLEVDKQTAYMIAKKSTTRFGRMFMEVLYFPEINNNNIRSFVRMEGAEHLHTALSQGRGAILATSHSGNWELLGAALAMNDFPIVAVVQKQTNAAMDKFINEYRTLAGMHVTYKTGVRDMVRLLGQGKIVGLLMDQDQHQQGIFVEFFGRMASTPQGPAALARMNDIPIIPAFISEAGDGTHVATFHPAVSVEKTDDRDRDILRATQTLTTIVETHIRKQPEEWFWLHNRWKTRPPANSQ